MLGRKNTSDTGKCSLALPLQHCNLQFFEILNIRVTERVGKKAGFKHDIPCVFESNIDALVSSSVSPAATQIFKRENFILSRID